MSVTLADAIVYLRANSADLDKGLGDAESKAKSWGDRVGGALKVGIGAAVAVTGIAIGVFVGGLVSSTQEAMASQEAIAQLEARIKSTGGVAGVTSQAAQNLASSLQGVTRFGDETILSGESLLLTFTNIGKDVFPQATETVLDMATAFKQDVPSAANMLGKALNDPIAGVTALRRVGVQLTDAQQDQIKAFMASGDIMSAQKIILGELKTEIGGAARAAGDTFAGKLDILNNKFSDVKERIGTAMLDPLSKIAGALIDAFDRPEVQQAITTLTDLLGKLAAEALPGVVNFLTGTVIPGFITFAGTTLPAVLSAGGAVWSWITGTAIPKLKEWGGPALNIAKEAFGKFTSETLPAVKTAGSDAWNWIVGTGIPKLKEWGGPALNIAKKGFETFTSETLPALKTAGENAWGWIVGTAIPKVEAWGQSFMIGLQPHVDTLWAKLQTFYNEIQPPLQRAWEALQRLWDTLVTLFNDHLKKAFDQLTEALGLSTEGGDGFATSLGDIIGKILEADLSALIWAITAAVDALTFAINIVSFGIQAAGFVIDGFSTGLSGIIWVVREVASAVGDMIDAFNDITDDIIPDWLQPGSPTPFENGLRGIASAMKELPDLGAMFGGLGSQTVNNNLGGIHFAGGSGAPQTASQASDSAFLLVNALAARGVAL